MNETKNTKSKYSIRERKIDIGNSPQQSQRFFAMQTPNHQLFDPLYNPNATPIHYTRNLEQQFCTTHGNNITREQNNQEPQQSIPKKMKNVSKYEEAKRNYELRLIYRNQGYNALDPNYNGALHQNISQTSSKEYSLMKRFYPERTL